MAQISIGTATPLCYIYPPTRFHYGSGGTLPLPYFCRWNSR